MSRVTTAGLSFRCGQHWFSIDAARVNEVARKLPTISVPGTKPWFLGLANLRGQIVHVIDATSLFQTGDPAPILDRTTIVLELDDTVYGLEVDEVDDLIGLGHDAQHPVPATLSADLRPFVRCVAECDDRLLLVVEPESLAQSAPHSPHELAAVSIE